MSQAPVPMLWRVWNPLHRAHRKLSPNHRLGAALPPSCDTHLRLTVPVRAATQLIATRHVYMYYNVEHG